MGALDGQIAVVTGASRGIGKGCALELGRAGATVYVTGRTTSAVEQTAREISDSGGRAFAAVCDHTDDEQVRALFERVAKEHDRLDVLVNSAFLDPGIVAGKKFWESPLDWYDTLNDAGTRGAYVAAYYAAPLMVPRQTGLIANVSSLGAQHYYQHVAYGMGKAAVDKLTRDAARDLRKLGVAIVSIWPYLVKTETVVKLVEDGAPLPLDRAESQRFVGRGVVAVATADDRMERSGRAWTSLELAEAYGYTDVDGQLPKGSTVPTRR